ncbi:MAG: carbohydrate ABC transporter permease [Clostridiales bacterium]
MKTKVSLATFNIETYKRKQLRNTILMYLILVLASCFYIIPIYVLLTTSLKDFSEVSLESMWNVPTNFSFESFYQAFIGEPLEGKIGLKSNLFSSIKLVIPATIFSALLGSINGYVLSKWKFRGSNIIFTLFLFGMFIPYQSILIPLVEILRSMNLYGTLFGLIFVHIIYGIPITTLIFKNYYDSIHQELLESAKIDGSSILEIYRYIIFPLSKPAFVVVIIWQFTTIWNEFLFASVITNRPDVQPVTVALNNLAGSFVVEWNVQMAGAFMAALPTLLIYILLQKYFIGGLLSGSVKG